MNRGMTKRYPGEGLEESGDFRFSSEFENGVWYCRGFDANGRHFNRCFKRLRNADSFLRTMKRGDAEEPHY